MITPKVFEAVNGILLVIVLAWILLFARYIWLEFSKPDKTFRQAWRGRTAAIATLMFLVGDWTIRLAAWRWRHYAMPADSETITRMLFVGVIIASWGGVCGIRHFAPERWGHGPWIMAPIIGAVFGFGMAYLAN